MNVPYLVSAHLVESIIIGDLVEAKLESFEAAPRSPPKDPYAAGSRRPTVPVEVSGFDLDGRIDGAAAGIEQIATAFQTGVEYSRE